MEESGARSRVKACSSVNQESKKGSEVGVNTEFVEKNLQICVEEISSYKQEGIIGGSFTYLAMKDEQTIMMITNSKGLRVIKSGIEVYSNHLPEDQFINGATYIQHLDCFCFIQGMKLYKKGLDKNPPFVHMTLKKPIFFAFYLKYSAINRRLFISTNYKYLSVINIDKKVAEMVFLRPKERIHIQKYQVFGEKGNKIATAASEGFVQLHVLNFGMKKVLAVNCVKIHVCDERLESVHSLAVCENHKFILVELRLSHHFCARILVLEVSGNSMTQKALIDQYDQKIRFSISLACCGYYRDHILWVGLENQQSTRVLLYDYDLETGELRELREKRMSQGEDEPCETQKIGSCFYYTGKGGKLMKLSLVI